MTETHAQIKRRRRMLAHNRADCANRIRHLRRLGMKVRTVWSGGTWAVLERASEYSWNLVSTINSRVDGVFVHSQKYDIEEARKS